jgi:uncharacterized protein (TIGR03437 family)
MVVLASAQGQTYTVQTVAGGGGFNFLNPGCSPTCGSPLEAVALDGQGNLFISLPQANIVARVDVLGGFSLIAGNGSAGFGGDNGPAVLASLSSPTGLAVDTSGNLYIADLGNNRIRMVSNGVITTVAGNGVPGSDGNGALATDAELDAPSYVAVSASGDLYISDTGNFWIRQVSNGVIATLAGNHTAGYGGDGGPALMAQLNGPAGLAVDAAGNVYFADSGNNRIRMISNGIITTVSGGGTSAADGVPATSAQLSSPMGIALDKSGNLYIADYGNYRIREVTNGIIATVAGNVFCRAGGQNGPATSVCLQPLTVAVDDSGGLYAIDQASNALRKVVDGVMTTIGFNTSVYLSGAYYSGGGYGSALDALLWAPQTVAIDSSGSIYIGDNGYVSTSTGLVWKVQNGTILPLAGGGSASGAGVPATSMNLEYSPAAIAVDTFGHVYFSDWDTSLVYEISNGVLETVAGVFGSPFGENVPATSVSLDTPRGIVFDSANNLYIADGGNGRIREVSNGMIHTIAGNEEGSNYGPPPGSAVYGGPNGVTMTSRFGPAGLAIDAAGNLYIADVGNNVIAELSNGALTVVAGSGKTGFSGDNGPAISAELNLSQETSLAVDSAGNIYVTDNNRIRRISNGVITTIGGNGQTGVSADNVPATSIPLAPYGLAVDSQGRIYFGDPVNFRVRVLIPSTASCSFAIAPAYSQIPASGGNFAVRLNTAPSCPWTITGLPDWISVANQSIAAGPGFVTLAAQQNGGGVREAQISISGQAFTITQAGTAAALPIVLSVSTAFGPPVIAQNTWIAINGANLVPPDTPAAGVFWTNAPSFATGQMPTQLGGVSVTVNGNPAYVWWFCSAATSPICARDQINVLTPLDSSTGGVPVVVTNGSVSSPPFIIEMRTAAPSLLVFDEARHIVAEHPNFSLVGPPTLYPGLTTPAASGETISLFGIGFGLPTTPVSAGSAIQSGPLPALPVCTAGTSLAQVASADLISPGLYQFNIVVPSSAVSGDNPVVCAFEGFETPSAQITKQ